MRNCRVYARYLWVAASAVVLIAVFWMLFDNMLQVSPGHGSDNTHVDVGSKEPVDYLCVNKTAEDILNDLDHHFPAGAYKTEIREREQRVQNRFNNSDLVERLVLERELSLLKIRSDGYKEFYEKKKMMLSAAYQALCQMRDEFSKRAVNAAHLSLIKGDPADANDLFARIESRYRKARQTDKINRAAEAVYQRGKIAEHQIDYRKAYRFFRQAVYYNPGNLNYLMDAARVADSMALYKNAIYFYQDALRVYRKNESSSSNIDRRIFVGLGQAWRSKGELGKAIEYYEMALKSDIEHFNGDHPNIAQDHYYLGMVWESRGNLVKAAGHYKEAVRGFEVALGKGHSTTRSVNSDLKRVTLKSTKVAVEQ